ncbi:YcxB family protein [Sphingomonas sp. CJ20]
MDAIEFTVGEADYLAAVRRNFADQLRGTRMVWGVAILSAVYVAIFLGLPLLDGERFTLVSVLVALAGSVATGAGVFVGIMLVARRLLPRRARRAYRQHRGLRDPIRAEWDDAGLRIAAATGESRLAWGDYVRWSADDRVLLLYQTDYLFNILPRAAMTEAQHASILAALAAHDVPRGRSR